MIVHVLAVREVLLTIPLPSTQAMTYNRISDSERVFDECRLSEDPHLA